MKMEGNRNENHKYICNVPIHTHIHTHTYTHTQTHAQAQTLVRNLLESISRAEWHVAPLQY